MRERGVSAKTGWCIIGGYILVAAAIWGLVDIAGLRGSGGAVLLGLATYVGIPAAYAALGGRDAPEGQDQRERPDLADVPVCAESRASNRPFSWIVAGFCLALVATGVFVGIGTSLGLGSVLAGCITALLYLPVPRWCRVTAVVIAVVVGVGLLVSTAILVYLFLIDPSWLWDF
jgi:hypothetical protein